MYKKAVKYKQICGLKEIYLDYSETRAMKRFLENGPLSDKELFEEYIYLAEIVKPVLSSYLVEYLVEFKKVMTLRF